MVDCDYTNRAAEIVDRLKSFSENPVRIYAGKLSKSWQDVKKSAGLCIRTSKWPPAQAERKPSSFTHLEIKVLQKPEKNLLVP